MTPEDKKALEENTKLTREIHAALVGSLGQPGLIQEHKTLKTDVTKLTRHFWTASGIFSGLGIAWELFKYLHDQN